MTKRIFISRKLLSDSPFHDLISEGIEIYDDSLIEFNALDFKLPKKMYQNLFFYSKKGIFYFFNSQKYDPNISYGVMGESSAIYFKNITGHKPEFVGQGSPKETADSLLTKIKGQNILFVKAKNSISSIQKKLDGNVQSDDLEVYSNDPKIKFELPNCDILIFTSPLNVRTYYSMYHDRGEQVLAIGSTTFKAIFECIHRKVKYPETASEYSLYNLVKSCLIS